MILFKIQFFSIALLLCSCMARVQTYDEHLKRLEDKVPKKALESENRWLLKFGDFTGDGRTEMIAFVYEITNRDEEMEWGNYYLYYSTQDALIVCDTISGGFYKEPEMLQVGTSAIIFYTIGYGGPTGESFCWRCTENSLVPIAMPGELTSIGDNYFRCSASGFDSFKADGDSETFSPGRCFYNYYYFFDGEQFREYGGKSLSEKQFSDNFGGAEILRYFRDNRLGIEDIYYRANDIININCSYRTEQYDFDNKLKSGTAYIYIELVLTNGTFKSEGLQPGRIKASLTPDRAVYPD